MIYQSRKRKYTSRKEKYDRSARFLWIIWVFGASSLVVWMFFRRQILIDWMRTFFY